ncbi:MAG TPA: type II toxin-antitoxin system VapC family toxin [Bryobacteraceae bacterium]|jgi:predicted nucleic acid-binding protein
MPFVLDASIPACWALQDEEDSRADAAFERMKSDEAVVPSLWWFEIRNIMVVSERRKRITESDTGLFLRDLAGLRVCVDREPEESVVLRLARTHGLSVYDAAYLELALREAIPLATLDAQLTAAARAEGSRLI